MITIKRDNNLTIKPMPLGSPSKRTRRRLSQNKGCCRYCNKEFSTRGLPNHESGCYKKQQEADILTAIRQVEDDPDSDWVSDGDCEWCTASCPPATYPDLGIADGQIQIDQIHEGSFATGVEELEESDDSETGGS